MNKIKHIKTEAIILKTTPVGEIHRNFVFISPDIGIQQATAFGALKHKSKFCATVQAFVRATLFLSRSNKSNYLKLEDIDNVSLNTFITSGIKNFYLASFYADVLLNSFFSPEEFKSHYYLLLYSLNLIENENIYASFLFFISKFLFLSGYKFNFANCIICNTTEEKNYYFDINNGGILCSLHAKNFSLPISQESCLFWNKFYTGKYLELKDVNIDEKCFKEIYKISMSILKTVFEKKLKTFSFLEELF